MTGFVVDKGILKLRSQLDGACPLRSKASDGTIGDLAHQERDSDHNPESPPPPGNPNNQVDAGDFTHDPANGADMNKVAEAIRTSRDRRVAYLIWNRRITGPSHAWKWDPYTGSDPHTNHLHVSVNDVHHDETQDWSIGVGLMDDKDFQAAAYRLEALVAGRDTVVGGPTKGEKVALTGHIEAMSEALLSVQGTLTALQAQLQAIQAAWQGPTFKGDFTISGSGKVQ